MTQINHSTMVAALVKPGAVIAEGITAQEADLWHGATGVAGEATEILDAVALHVLSGMSLDQENMVEELGDVEFYLEQVRSNLGLTRAETLFSVGERPYETLYDEAVLLAIAAGNLLDQAKKVAIYKKAADISTILICLSQIEMTLAIIRDLTDITYEQAIDGNIAKLSVRYAGLTYSDSAAQVRADKA